MGVLKNTKALFVATDKEVTFNFKGLDDRISVKNLRVHFDEIKQITDASLSKSDRKKIRQALVIRLVNELYGFDEEVVDHAQLESLLKNSSALREFVKSIRGAITGMTTMMGDYVDKGISFDSWQKITEGRDTLKAHNKTKAETIKKLLRFCDKFKLMH